MKMLEEDLIVGVKANLLVESMGSLQHASLEKSQCNCRCDPHLQVQYWKPMEGLSEVLPETLLESNKIKKRKRQENAWSIPGNLTNTPVYLKSPLEPHTTLSNYEAYGGTASLQSLARWYQWWGLGTRARRKTMHETSAGEQQVSKHICWARFE